MHRKREQWGVRHAGAAGRTVVRRLGGYCSTEESRRACSSCGCGRRLVCKELALKQTLIADSESESAILDDYWIDSSPC